MTGAGEKTPVETEIASVVEKVSGLTVATVLKSEAVADEFRSDSSGVDYTVTLENGEEIIYSLRAIGEDEYGIKSSNSEIYYKVHSLLAENIMKFSLATLFGDGKSDDENETTQDSTIEMSLE